MEIDSELTEKVARNNQHPLKMTATIFKVSKIVRVPRHKYHLYYLNL